MSKVTSSECSRDQPFIVFEDQLESEEECVSICQNFANIPTVGCTFAAWQAGVVLGTCILYKETFAEYLAPENKEINAQIKKLAEFDGKI